MSKPRVARWEFLWETAVVESKASQYLVAAWEFFWAVRLVAEKAFSTVAAMVVMMDVKTV